MDNIISDPKPDWPSAAVLRHSNIAGGRIAPLRSVVMPLAKSRPDGLVPLALVATARQALRPARRGARALGLDLPPLHGAVTWAVLGAALASAAGVVAAFHGLAAYREEKERRARHGETIDLAWDLIHETLSSLAPSGTGPGSRDIGNR